MSKLLVFFVLILIVVAVAQKYSPYQDLSQLIGLTKPVKKGKVLFSSHDNKSISKIVIMDPHLYVQPAPFNSVSNISFRFQIIKGSVDKELILSGGKLVIKLIAGNQTIDTIEIPVSDEFNVVDPGISGSYFSPKPLMLKPGVDAIELILEMTAKTGNKLSSKLFRLIPETVQ